MGNMLVRSVIVFGYGVLAIGDGLLGISVGVSVMEYWLLVALRAIGYTTSKRGAKLLYFFDTKK